MIHTVAYDDGSRGRRSVAHRLSFVEMVVPYGDPHDPNYRKNAFDAGEDGLGKNAHSLKKVGLIVLLLLLVRLYTESRHVFKPCSNHSSLLQGCDCLGYIKYFDAHFTNFHGGVETIENVVCMHEEDHGILWKHQDWRTGSTQVRRSRRLTVSFFCTVANYEYGFFWHFYQVLKNGIFVNSRRMYAQVSHTWFFSSIQDGRIEAEVKLTGILSLGALKAGEVRRHGTVIAPGLYAPVHQHFFVARMDMAVDCKPGEGLNQVRWHPSQILRASISDKCLSPSLEHSLKILYWLLQA